MIKEKHIPVVLKECTFAIALLLLLPPAAAADADRGEGLYTDTYKCYACHGYNAQTGYKRLKPMRFTQEGFIRIVRTGMPGSGFREMPAYADVSKKDLADIYAYILSIPFDAPGFEEIPLLEDIRNRKMNSLGD